MNIPKPGALCLSAVFAGAALLLSTGCVSTDTIKREILEYQPARSPVQFDACAVVEVTDTMTPEMRSFKHLFDTDQGLANWQQAMAETIYSDISNSGLFTQVHAGNGPRPDYRIVIRSEESKPSDFRLRVTMNTTDCASGQPLSVLSREISLGQGAFSYHPRGGLQKKMTDLKADLTTELQEKISQRKQQTALAQAEAFQKATLADLLVGAEKTVALARERNRALVAAKTQQLPDILRNWKTDELTTLVVKIEQAILDLNHECEVAKDKAQQVTATNDDARQIDELRGLAISYRERIELLKPILTAVKEEIANRGR